MRKPDPRFMAFLLISLAQESDASREGESFGPGGKK